VVTQIDLVKKHSLLQDIQKMKHSTRSTYLEVPAGESQKVINMSLESHKAHPGLMPVEIIPQIDSHKENDI
jgi:hypothetical protein